MWIEMIVPATKIQNSFCIEGSLFSSTRLLDLSEFPGLFQLGWIL